MTPNLTLTERQLAALNGELGWGAEANDDGEVAFDSGRGYRIWLSNYANDTEYLHMHTGFGLRWFLEQAEVSVDVDSAEVELRLFKMAAELNRRLKGVKVNVVPEDDIVVFSAEDIIAGQDRLPSVEHLAAIAPRLRSMIRNAVSELLDEAEKLQEPKQIDLSAWEPEFADLPSHED